MYRALYRKWRPQKFSDVVGQQAVTSALTNQIAAGRVAHAYLFTGTRGTGKTTCAKIFAKAVNCENPDGAEPCGRCVPCVGLEDGSILDVVEIDAASNNSVDDIRDLRDETAYRPSRCRYKVYIIDEVHMLSTSAFNALLKIMEEPPSHIIFILATTEMHKVPATILSRCQQFDFTRIPAGQMAERLLYIAQQEEIELSADAAGLIARLADGALRDALSLLDTCAGFGEPVDEALVRRMAGVSDKGYLFVLGDAIARGDVEELLVQVASLREQSLDVRRLTEELVSHYRALLLARAKPDGSLLTQLGEQEKQRVLQAAAETDSRTAIGAVRRLAAALDRMGRSPDPRIELELALFDLASPPSAPPASPPQPVKTAAGPAASAPPFRPAPPEQTAPAAPAAPPEEDAPPWDTAEPTEARPAPETPPESPSPEPPAALPEEPDSLEAAEFPPSPPKPATETADGVSVFEAWPEVVARMKGLNKMLYAYMQSSTAYVDGRRVLIDGGDMFLSFMRTDEMAAGQIKQVIQEVTGVRYGIGPYTPPDTPAAPRQQAQPASPRDTLRDWEQKGLPVEYK